MIPTIDSVFNKKGILDSYFDNYEVRQGQIELARAVQRSISDKRSLVAEGPTGCHALGQGILMFDGTAKSVEEIGVGEFLMGPDSKPREVLEVHNDYGNMVEIVPVKGSSWIVNDEHILTLSRTGTGELKDVSVKDWKSWSNTQKHLWKLVRTGVDFQSVTGFLGALPLDPYFLGVLLGDGGLATGGGSISVTKSDVEIREMLRDQVDVFDLTLRIPSDRPNQMFLTNPSGGSNPIKNALRYMGLHGHGAGEKFIPYQYKVSSRVDRLSILAGLIDTDGSYGNGCYDYVSKSKMLANDVAFVARSLGLSANVSPCTKSCQTGFVGEYFRVCLSGDLSVIPCRIPRKIARKREQVKSVLRTGFSVEDVGVDEYYGFTVDRDGRYLLDDFTVTHNSGKSFAYLTPAILQLTKGVKKAVIATANIALQEQLIEKDLPALEKMLPVPFKYSLLKGRNNYVCKEKMNEALGKKLLQDSMSSYVMRWYNNTQEGDKSELSIEYKHWGLISAGPGDCLGPGCKHYKTCFANLAKWSAEKSEIIVTNYHVIIKGGGVPPHQVLICDEAHDLEDIARSALGWKISRWTIDKILSWIQRNQGSENTRLSNRLFVASKNMFKDVQEKIGKRDTLRLLDPDWSESVEDIIQVLIRCADIAGSIAASADRKDKKVRAEKMMGRINELVNHLIQIRDVDNEKWVFWLSKERDRGNTSYHLNGAPIIVSDLLPGIMYSEPKTTVFISATMTSGGSFKFVREQLGVPDNAGEIIAPSPFDLKRQGIIVVPRDAPPPNVYSPEDAVQFYDAVAHYATKLILKCQGKSLLLFTSWRSLSAVYDKLSNDPKLDEFRIMKQGDAPRTHLIDEFKHDVNSVLLGVASLWQGIDVPGEALTGLLIDKIPFPVPTDPIQLAVNQHIERSGGNPFMQRSIPQATISLSQGVGRLIRTKKDKGVVVIMDNRLIEKAYGAKIINSMPEFTKVRSFSKVDKFMG